MKLKSLCESFGLEYFEKAKFKFLYCWIASASQSFTLIIHKNTHDKRSHIKLIAQFSQIRNHLPSTET